MAVLGRDGIEPSTAAFSGAAGRLATAFRRPKAKITSKAAPFVEIALAVAIGLILARAGYALFAPLPTPSQLPVAAAQTSSGPEATGPAGNPFRSATAPVAPIELEEDPGEDLAETSLDLTLHGTYTNPSTGVGAAAIRLPDGSQKRFEIGQEITNGVVLDRVYPEQVTIVRDGVRESLRMENRDRDARASSPRPVRSTRAAPRTPPRRVGNRIVPVQETGALPGVSIGGAAYVRPKLASGQVKLELQPGGNYNLFEALGLRAGDVVVSVDNRPIGNNVPAAIERLRGLSSKSNFSIVVERDGVPVPIDIDLEEFDELED